jgi:hypothetical protein
MHWYDPGTTVLMQRTTRPRRSRVYYLILDTAIGAQEGFIEELLKEKLIQIEDV